MIDHKEKDEILHRASIAFGIAIQRVVDDLNNLSSVLSSYSLDDKKKSEIKKLFDSLEK